MKCAPWTKKINDCLTKLAWLPPLVARITVGWVFLESGWGKLHNLSKVTEFFTELGIPAPHLQAPFVATVEFAGGILVLIGLATRIASAPLAMTMVVALLTAKRADISSVSDLFGLSEFLYIVLLSWLFVFGAGKISIDGFCQSKCKS